MSQTPPLEAFLCWDPVDGAAGYNVRSETMIGGEWLALTADVGQATNTGAGLKSHILPYEAAGPTIIFKVQAYGGSGEDYWIGPWSNPLSYSCAFAGAVAGRQVCPDNTCRLPGDMDCSGSRTVTDAAILFSAVVGITHIPECTP